MAVSVLPGAEPYAHDGGDIGVLLVHGYTSTPQSMRGWAEHFAGASYTVRLPRLPGHGTRWQDVNQTRWQDWYAEVDRAFGELRTRCAQVFVAGLSMGGLLSTKPGPRTGAAGGRADRRQPDLPPRQPAPPAAADAAPRGPGPSIANDVKMVGGGAELAYDRNPLRDAPSRPFCGPR